MSLSIGGVTIDKSGTCHHVFLNNFWVSIILLGQVYLFWKISIQTDWKLQEKQEI